jgi:SAM-dependent methyltransferase
MVHGRKNSQTRGAAIEPCIALNAVCPYYTMFALEFPMSVLSRVGRPNLRVLDPFCGRGTTIFAARLSGYQVFGIDSSPIAVAIAGAKLAEATAENVRVAGDQSPGPIIRVSVLIVA